MGCLHVRVLRIPSWRGADSAPEVIGLEKDEFFSHQILGLGVRRLALWPIVGQAFYKIAQTSVLMQMQ